METSQVGHAGKRTLPFGLAEIDDALPGGGLTLGALHEVAGTGSDTEDGAAPAQLIAGIAARLVGGVVWIVERVSPFGAGLACVGLDPARVVFVGAGRSALLAMEESLRHADLAAVVCEMSGRLGLTASRRLQLAAEASGVTAFALRLSRTFDDPMLAEPNAASSRWRVGHAPSTPALPHAPDVAGLGRAHWHLNLVRARGAQSRSWLVEAPDHSGRLALVGPSMSTTDDSLHLASGHSL
ncbi:MAG: ImuA family protein [Janthinobacterium lividum]